MGARPWEEFLASLYEGLEDEPLFALYERGVRWMPASMQRTEPPAFSIVGMSSATSVALSSMADRC